MKSRIFSVFHSTMESLRLEVNSEKTKIERQGICFHGITYTVTEGIFKKTKKRILKDVS